MKSVKVKIREIEDIKYAKEVLTKSEIEFLETYYTFEYQEDVTIRNILLFFVNGLKEYYMETNFKNEIYTDYFLKSTFELFYNESYVRIFDLDTPIAKIDSSELEIKFLIGIGRRI